jgi:hypothetical protein
MTTPPQSASRKQAPPRHIRIAMATKQDMPQSRDSDCFCTRPKRAWLRVCVSLLAWPGSMMALQPLDRLPTPGTRFQCASLGAILKAPRQARFMLFAETQSGWPRYVVAGAFGTASCSSARCDAFAMAPGCKSATATILPHEAVAFSLPHRIRESMTAPHTHHPRAASSCQIRHSQVQTSKTAKPAPVQLPRVPFATYSKQPLAHGIC